MKFVCRPTKKRLGFTLVEVMVALLILGMSSISILGMSIMSTKMAKQNETRSVVQSLARSQIDRLISVSQQNRVVVVDKPISLDADLLAQLPAENLSATYRIKPVSGSKNLQSIEIVVRWRNQVGGSASAMSTVSVGKTFASVTNADWIKDPWNPNPVDQLFYTPPPPPPPPPPVKPTGTTGSSGSSGGSGGSGTTGSSGSSGSSGTSSTGGSSGTSGTAGSSGGSGSGTTTASPPPPSGFNLGGGNKWK